MSRGPLLAGLGTGVAAASLLLAACGSDAGATVAEGKQVFVTAGCATCHTLQDAGATGTVGPDLDEMQPGQDVVEVFVTNGSGNMPAFGNKLSKADIEAVAKYVNSVAGGEK